VMLLSKVAMRGSFFEVGAGTKGGGAGGPARALDPDANVRALVNQPMSAVC
jgi:hypothetical protein